MDRVVIACEVFKPELRLLETNLAKCVYLPQGLHRSPGELAANLKATLRAVESQWHPRTVVLAYGQCGGGVIGLSAQQAVLMLPRADDCIDLLLGETKKVEAGTFYLTPGWVEFASDPYREYLKYREVFGEEDARWCSLQMMKGYHRVCLISHKTCEPERYRGYARAMAGFFGLEYLEVQGDIAWLRRLVRGADSSNLVRVPPGVPVAEEHFLKLPALRREV